MITVFMFAGNIVIWRRQCWDINIRATKARINLRWLTGQQMSRKKANALSMKKIIAYYRRSNEKIMIKPVFFKISNIWWKPFRWCAIFLIFRLREKCRKIYIIGTGLAVYGENGRNWINSRPRPDKKFTENFQTNLWKQQNREFGGRIGNFRDWSV